jgi:hypothetical protein
MSELNDDTSETTISYLRAVPTQTLPLLMKFRSVNPLYGLFLLKQLGLADRAEQLQAFESVLEMPPSMGPNVRVPKQDILPKGTLATERLDPLLLELGLANVAELVPKTQEELDAEWEERRRFGGLGYIEEERIYVIPLAEKLKRLFEFEYPLVHVFVNPVWAAGEVLLEFNGDFDKYIVSQSLQKQEGVIFRHLLRLILLLNEFSEMPPADGSFEEWKANLNEMSNQLTVCCNEVDPKSTQETLEWAKNNTDEVM